MSGQRYTPEETAVLLPFVARRVPDCHKRVLVEQLPGRSRWSVEGKLAALRQKANTTWRLQS